MTVHTAQSLRVFLVSNNFTLKFLSFFNKIQERGAIQIVQRRVSKQKRCSSEEKFTSHLNPKSSKLFLMTSKKNNECALMNVMPRSTRCNGIWESSKRPRGGKD